MTAIETQLPKQVIKRNGSYVAFDVSRVERCVNLCYGDFEGEEERPATPAETIVESVLNAVSHRFSNGTVPTVEQIQDLVELSLANNGEFAAARRYILYREMHAKQRVVVPGDIQEAFDLDATFFPTALERFMFYDKYSRFNWELMRRETWPETVDRVIDYLTWLSEGKLGHMMYERIRQAILHRQVMPSMRLLAMAGDAAKRNSMSIYNCSYLPIDSIDAFAEIMLISLAGCGVGYSVEREHVEQFERIKRQTGEKLPTHVIEDSSEGWGEAVRVGLRTWVNGQDIDFDSSLLRLAGMPLKTKGGRSSGPEPLLVVLKFLRDKILSRQGTFLRTLDAHDMACVAGGAAVSGGVRRTALIALFDWDDQEMRTCKDGAKLDQNPWRWNANNSAVWPEDLEQIDLIDQFKSMFENRRGEPGIFSRWSIWKTKPARRLKKKFGSNPCGEINLRPFQFCNLSIAVARPNDTVESLNTKVEIATIIGTIQSLATNFPGMRPEWKKNCEEERLLGVDITGARDCPLITAEFLASAKELSIITNEAVARSLGINPSAAITCNKPSGNSSQFLNVSMGINARWSEFYIRNIRVSPHTPVFQVLKTCGVPMDPENGQTAQDATSWVIHFPCRSPEGSKTRKDFSAIDQCEWWLMHKLNWTEHNPSVTITYQPDEAIGLMQWVWDHKDVIGGMAFLPADDARYAQMPYEEITQEQYEKLVTEFPPIDFSLLYAYERTDMTTAAQELACMAGACEV